MGSVDAAPADLETVRRILREHAPGLEARAFGSRVSWTARETSDLDLALMTNEPLNAARMAVLRSAFTDSRLPFRVDVVDWAGASDSFRKVIESEYVTLVGKEERQGSEGTARPGLSPRHREIGRDHVGDRGGAWPLVEIGDVAEIVGGGTPSTRNAGYFDGDVPWLTPKDLSGSPARVVARGSRNLSRAGLANSSARLVPPGAVLLSTRAPIGYVAIAGGELSTNQGFRNLLPRGSVRSDFLYYWLKASTEALERHAVGTTFRELPGSVLKRIRIPLPPLSEQRAIGQVLGALDDKIDLNRRMNETLEAMARALFKSWFVDFGPVRAKTEGRDTGLPDHIADLFPDRLVDSELGEIPEGWAAVPLPDLIEINPTRPLHRGAVAPYLDMTNMPTKGHAPDKIIDRPFGSGMRFINGDTLVARITPCLENGKTAYVDFLEQGQIGWGSTEYIVLRPKPPLPCEFAYCLARSNRFREFAIRNMTGTSGRQRVSAKVLARFILPSPPDTVCSVFRQLIRPLIARAREAVNEARTLATLRDALLPKLVSGEVRLGEAVERLESAA